MLANLSSLVHKRVKTTKKTNVKIIKRAKKSQNSGMSIVSVSETSNRNIDKENKQGCHYLTFDPTTAEREKKTLIPSRLAQNFYWQWRHPLFFRYRLWKYYSSICSATLSPGSIPATSNTVEYEGQLVKQC
jgi:hypothetical protein